MDREKKDNKERSVRYSQGGREREREGGRKTEREGEREREIERERDSGR